MDELEEYRLHRRILCIDLKSFYASVECAITGLDPFKTPLVVADKERGPGSIILAVSPYLRNKGVPSRLRISELQRLVPNEEIIYRKPSMRLYLEYSSKVVGIYLKYLSKEDIHIYSVDECFLDFTDYSKIYRISNKTLAKRILKDIRDELNLTATCGIGPNMLLSKLALDIESKKAKDFIAEWDYKDIEEKLWPVTPLNKMWGIGSRMVIKLNQMGLFKIGDIANYDKDKLKKKFGVIGEELWYHTHGIDMSLISEAKYYKPKSKSYGISQVLFRDYHDDETLQIIREMTDDLCARLRLAHKKGTTFALGINYSKEVGGGFGRQISFETPTFNEDVIFNAFKEVFRRYYDLSPVRRVSVSVTKLVDASLEQLNLFVSTEKAYKAEKLAYSLDKIRHKMGNNSVMRASSKLEASTREERNKQIGGHNA